MTNSTLLDKIRGVLYGCAAGDALGYEVEFISWDSIQNQYGENGIQEYKLHQEKAQISDDTQMALFTAAGMALAKVHQTQTDEAIYRAYLDWYVTQNGSIEAGWPENDWLLEDKSLYHRQAPGNTCLNALGSGSMGTLDKRLNNSKGCGAVMRTMPCGFVDPAMMPAFPAAHAAAILGAQAGVITHGADMGWIPAAMLADMIYRIVYLSASIPDAARDSLAMMLQLFPHAQGIYDFKDMVNRAIDWGTEDSMPGQPWDEQNIQELGGGWVGDEALAIAIYCACKYQNDFDACIRAAVNHSGDSDSTGAIAGSIVGASLGMQGIDSRWINPLDVRDAIEKTAESLSAVARPL